MTKKKELGVRRS